MDPIKRLAWTEKDQEEGLPWREKDQEWDAIMSRMERGGAERGGRGKGDRWKGGLWECRGLDHKGKARLGRERNDGCFVSVWKLRTGIPSSDWCDGKERQGQIE